MGQARVRHGGCPGCMAELQGALAQPAKQTLGAPCSACRLGPSAACCCSSRRAEWPALPYELVCWLVPAPPAAYCSVGRQAQCPGLPCQLGSSGRPVPAACCLLQLRSGSAEVFGTSLDLGDRVTLGGVKVAIYTWQGAELEVEGRPDVM